MASPETAIRDEGENVAVMEPMLPSEAGSRRHRLDDLALELTSKAHALAGQLHPNVRAAVGTVVRSMNCYYSNLIEGHNTHPVDIERALRQDYSSDTSKRVLQLEAKAHIEVQSMIDRPEGKGTAELPKPSASIAFIKAIHKEFCERLPEELLWVKNPDSDEKTRVVPGEFRQNYVKVGRLIPVSPGAIARFVERFEAAYRPADLPRIRQIIAVPAAHHRLLWIHPFIDGNGRVTRLMSHAALREIGVGTSLWSVSRGLARNEAEYKRLLMIADEPRRDDVDGRGALSEAALAEFCEFFLGVCVDQISFMEGLLEPASLIGRIENWFAEQVREGALHPKSFGIVREALLMGELDRGRIGAITDLGERRARAVLSTLIERGILASDSHRSAVRIAFPAEIAERWFPNLYPAIPTGSIRR